MNAACLKVKYHEACLKSPQLSKLIVRLEPQLLSNHITTIGHVKILNGTYRMPQAGRNTSSKQQVDSRSFLAKESFYIYLLSPTEHLHAVMKVFTLYSYSEIGLGVWCISGFASALWWLWLGCGLRDTAGNRDT